MGRHGPGRRLWAGGLVDCQAFIRKEEKQIKFQEFRRDPEIGDPEFPATDAYRTADPAHVIGTENRERLLILVEWRPTRVARLQAEDAFFRPIVEVRANHGNHAGG